MNYKISQLFPVESLSSAATTTLDVALKGLAAFSTDLTTNLGAAPSLPAEFKLVFGTQNSKFGTFKTGTIKQSNILSVTRTTADLTTKPQITYVGFDEVNDFKTPTIQCEDEYVLTLKIDEYWSKGIYQPMIQESVRAKAPCCADCAGGCDSVDTYAIMSTLASKVNASPLLGKYVSASVVYKGTPAAYKYIITLPDAGNSTAENAALAALQAAFPAGTYGTIAITADTDGDSDADSTGNTTFEIATPLISDVSLMPTYNGIAWEAVLTTAASVTASGIKLTGKVLDEFGNACVPDAVPYVFNLVRFKAIVHEGPYNTQDFDIENPCAPWAITTTQNIQYPIGDKKAMAEMERHLFGNNLPAVAEARRYWNPIYNNDSDEFLYVPGMTAPNGFDMYEITYLEDSPVGFEKKTRDVMSVIILVPDNGSTESAAETAIRTFLNALLGKTYSAD